MCNECKYMQKKKKIVTVGGGTGSFTLLSGLKKYEHLDLSAIVSMADDGGSTGVLRDELGVLPPGDVRQCLTALSEEEDLVRSLMSYRFGEGSLAGHSFGNILLAALEKVSGDFVRGVEVASRILKVSGSVIPVTGDVSHLVVSYEERLIKGENAINHADFEGVGFPDIFYESPVALHERARMAILEADIVVLGPGNYFCSLIPNLIVKGFSEAIQETKAKVVFPVNLTNKHGHTLGYGVARYVAELEALLGRPLDMVLINNKEPSGEQIKKYALVEGDGVLVTDDYRGENAHRAPLLATDIVSYSSHDTIASSRSFIRHDKDALAKEIVRLL